MPPAQMWSEAGCLGVVICSWLLQFPGQEVDRRFHIAHRAIRAEQFIGLLRRLKLSLQEAVEQSRLILFLRPVLELRAMLLSPLGQLIPGIEQVKATLPHVIPELLEFLRRFPGNGQSMRSGSVGE